MKLLFNSHSDSYPLPCICVELMPENNNRLSNFSNDSASNKLCSRAFPFIGFSSKADQSMKPICFDFGNDISISGCHVVAFDLVAENNKKEQQSVFWGLYSVMQTEELMSASLKAVNNFNIILTFWVNENGFTTSRKYFCRFAVWLTANFQTSLTQSQTFNGPLCKAS